MSRSTDAAMFVAGAVIAAGTTAGWCPYPTPLEGYYTAHGLTFALVPGPADTLVAHSLSTSSTEGYRIRVRLCSPF